MTDSNLRVVSSPNPFGVDTVDVELPAGGSILDLMEATLCGGRQFLGNAWVFITDRELTREPIQITRENWHRVYPKPGTHVSVRVIPQGGGGDKNPLRTILTIAVISASIYVGGLAAGWAAEAGWSAAAAHALGAAAGAATPAVGISAINARLPEASR